MKTILVTGATRGMGEAAARLLTSEGYAVIGIYNTNEEEAKKLENELPNFTAYQCDFAGRANTMALIEKLKGTKLAGIVNSAGIYESVVFEDLDMKTWEKTFEINVHAPILLIHGLRNDLEEAASIVNIASTDGMFGSEVGLAYAASKAALMSVTRCLANTLADRKIRVNTIAPGWIGDGMQAPLELLEDAAWFNPLRRTGTYEEMANVVSFLLSDKSTYVNGTTLVADGGDIITNYVLRRETEMKKKQDV